MNKYTTDKWKAFLSHAGIIPVIVFALTGCFKNEKSHNSIDTEGDKTNVAIALPVPLTAAAIDSDCIKAWISVDDTQRTEMPMSNNQAHVQIQGLSLGDHSVTVEFECTDSTYGIVTLATTTFNVTLIAGTNPVTLDANSYTYIDSDNDFVSNYLELANNTHPGDPKSTPNTITNINYNNNTSVQYNSGQYSQFTFDYTTIENSGIKIFARPFFNNSPVANASVTHSGLLGNGSGNGGSSFTVTVSGSSSMVDQVKLTMTDATETKTLAEETVTVDYEFLPIAANGVNMNNIQFTPASPATVTVDETINISFIYTSSLVDGFTVLTLALENGFLSRRIDPFFAWSVCDNNLYANSVYPQGNGTVNCAIHLKKPGTNTTIDQVWIRIVDNVGSDVTGTFIDVNYTIPEDGIPGGLVADYTFTGSADDSSGNNHHGMLVSNPNFEFEGYVSLNGVDQYIEIANEAAFDLQEYTVLVSLYDTVAYPDNNTVNHHYILSKGENYGNFNLAIANPLGGFEPGRVIYAHDTSAGLFKQAASTGTVTFGNYYTLAVTLTTTELKYYHDGALETTIPLTTDNAPLTNNAPLRIGHSGFTTAPLPDYANLPYQGAIDRVMIFNRALSATELENLR